MNGTGKTTTIGKLAQQYHDEGKRAVLVGGRYVPRGGGGAIADLGAADRRAGDFGRAERRSAGLAFDALTRAKAEGADVLLIDTAGRLHNKAALMEELAKMIRVLRKQDPTAPHSVLLVLDATTGQNAIQQVKVFKEMVDVTGLVVTKLDGSARGGIVVALAETFGLPVHAVGVGEQASDLRPFDAFDFARGLVGADLPRVDRRSGNRLSSPAWSGGRRGGSDRSPSARNGAVGWASRAGFSVRETGK